MIIIFQFLATGINKDISDSMICHVVRVGEQNWLNCAARNYLIVSIFADQVLESIWELNCHCVPVTLLAQHLDEFFNHGGLSYNSSRGSTTPDKNEVLPTIPAV